MVIFRENTEDVYAGIEWAKGTPEARTRHRVPVDGDGQAHPSRLGHRHQADLRVRHRSAWCAWRSSTPLDNKRKTVTLVHKGNIMKFTEGAFRDWGYEVAKAEFRDRDRHRGRSVGAGASRAGKVAHQRPHRRQHVPAGADAPRRVRRDRDAEPERRLPVRRAARRRSAASASRRARNINDDTGHAVFEATHGTAPKYAGPGQGQSRLGHPLRRDDAPLPGLDRGGRPDRSRAWRRRSPHKQVTYDFARQMDGATELKTSQFADAIIENM